ncbi:MAG: 16S rRNA (guanine(966)-N(2))-methyltransferase RsmD [Acidobacteria bacterium]|nr:16S rRNA (guanine(966)-N(2))-methyltransferase RsmD [Acidobacteriota bacterium]
MRVIGGRFKGRRLHAPADLEIRPTISRLKECYFNIVQERVPGARFLDLCAGTGSMGIEALSRGAREAVFLDSGRQAEALIRRNLQICGVPEGARLITGDLFRELPRLGLEKVPFDLVYFDPPYFRGIYEHALALVGAHGLLAADGLLAANHFKKVVLPERVGPLGRVREVRQGDSVLAFYAPLTSS